MKGPFSLVAIKGETLGSRNHEGEKNENEENLQQPGPTLKQFTY
jgi:hypothetical protein